VLDFIRYRAEGNTLFPDSASETVESSGVVLIDLYFDGIAFDFAQSDLVTGFVTGNIPFVLDWEGDDGDEYQEVYRLISAGTGAISLSNKPQNWEEQGVLVAGLFPAEHQHSVSVLDRLEQLRGMDLIDRLPEEALLYWIARGYKVGTDVVVPCGAYQWRVEDKLVDSKALSVKLGDELDSLSAASKVVRLIGVV
jgi:hypothetical protein